MSYEIVKLGNRFQIRGNGGIFDFFEKEEYCFYGRYMTGLPSKNYTESAAEFISACIDLGIPQKKYQRELCDLLAQKDYESRLRSIDFKISELEERLNKRRKK